MMQEQHNKKQTGNGRALRVPIHLVHRCDRLLREMLNGAAPELAAMPSMHWGSVVRIALTLGLDQLESKYLKNKTGVSQDHDG